MQVNSKKRKMKETTYLYSIFFGILLLSNCAIKEVKTPQTQLQIREFQTHNYEINSKTIVMKALLNVLQDMGFVIRNTNTELGLISASKEVDLENKLVKNWKKFWSGADGRWTKNLIIDSTFNVSNFGNNIRVRASFQTKTLNNKGEVLKIEDIIDPVFYIDLFMKIDKSIFIEKQNI